MQERHCRKPWIFPIIGLIVLFWIFKSMAFPGFGHHGFGPHAFGPHALDFPSALMGLNAFLSFVVRLLGIILSIALIVQAFKSRAYLKAQAAQGQASAQPRPTPPAQPSAASAQPTPDSSASAAPDQDDDQNDPPSTGDTVRL